MVELAINKNITMKQYNGTDYDTLYPKTIAEQVDGVYSKEQVASTITKALFGLTSSAVPDDIFAAIGKYKQYWWRRRSLAYKEARTTVATQVFIDHNYGRTLKVANSISINQDSAEITLNNPENFEIDTYSTTNDFRNRLQELLDKAPCYITGLESDTTAIYYLPVDGTLSYSTQDTVMSYTICFYYSNKTTNRIWFGTTSDVKAQVVSSEAGTGSWQYIQSSNRSAYPDSGTQDGYEYEYLGVPFDNAVTAPKIEVGSYVGTGTYGVNNPNTLTFGFVPKVWGIYAIDINKTGGLYGQKIFAAYGKNIGFYINQLSTSYEASVTYNGNSISWYSANVDGQLNNQYNEYYYFAIG